MLGDTFVRMLRARGHHVEVQNYIDNTGVQVADVVVGFHFLEKKTPAEVAALIADERRSTTSAGISTRAFRSTIRTIRKPSPGARRRCMPSKPANGELAELAHLVADAIVNAHLATMLRLNIQYDVLPRESEILHLKFWAAAFELLKERKAIYFETEGKNRAAGSCRPRPSRGEDDANEDSKVIVRSNGTVTYVGKDIAYQLWKFGLLGKDFYYRPLTRYADGNEVWVSTDEPQPRPSPPFGKGDTVYNVIDFAAVLPAGRRGRRPARAGFRRPGQPLHPLLLRNGGALAALLRRSRHRTFRRRQAQALCRNVRAAKVWA